MPTMYELVFFHLSTKIPEDRDLYNADVAVNFSYDFNFTDVNFTRNNTLGTEEGPNYNWWALIAIALVICTAAGNVLVCLAIYLERRLQNVTNYFLMSLAITDLLVAILVMPLGILTLVKGFFPLSPVYCLTWICLDVLLCTASIMHLCTISIDRYLSLRYPMRFGRNKTRKRVTIKIVFVWILSTAMSLPLSLMYSKNAESVLIDGSCQIPDPLYKAIGSVISFYIPLGVMLLTYALTVQLLARQRKGLGAGWAAGWLGAPPIDSQTVVEFTGSSLSTSKSLTIVILIFISSLLALGLPYKQFPELEEHEKQSLKLPWELEDAKHLGLVLDRYKEKYFYEVLFGVFLIYIFLQTFAIPGSIFLSILSGFLFPFYQALLLVCCCSAMGSSLCFFLSNLLEKKVMKKFLLEGAEQWANAVIRHQNNLLNYIILLRVTPFLPNWYINMSAPVIGVPLVPFALGTFIGVAPPSFVAIQAGQTLHTLASTSDAWSWTSVTVLSVFALIPVLIKENPSYLCH